MQGQSIEQRTPTADMTTFWCTFLNENANSGGRICNYGSMFNYLRRLYSSTGSYHDSGQRSSFPLPRVTFVFWDRLKCRCIQGWVCVNSRSVNAVFLTQLINASRFQCMRINAPKRPVIPVILRYFLTKERKILPARRPVGALFPGVPVPVWL